MVPEGIKILSRTLSPQLSAQLFKVWNKQWKKLGQPKLLIENVDQYDKIVSWNTHKIDRLNDVWFKKLVRHICNIEHSPEIDAAVRLHLSDDYEQIKRYIGHQIFAQMTDGEIAKQWNLPEKTITALRMIFFDFGALPPSPVAKWGVLVQWVNNGDIRADEFALYKRVHELGPLGLKAQVAGSFLEDDERLKVREYLTKTAMTNTFNVQFATRTPRDALIYNRVISDLVRMDLQREEVKVRQQECKLLEMQVEKIGRELNVGKVQELQSEDLRLIQGAIDMLGKTDNEPRYRTVFDISKVK